MMETHDFDWGALTPRVVHPLKVAIVEAMLWIDRPLSASELRELLGQSSTSGVSYHVKQLAKHGAIRKVREQQVRGVMKTSYFFPGGVPRNLPD